jgi:uncharacterized protein
MRPALVGRRPGRKEQVTEIRSHAEVATDKPVAYMRQLCKHFGHKVDASFGDDSGHIQFDFGRCELHANNGTLTLAVSAADADSHERMERVIGSHLERFGRRDELSVAWQE